MEPRLNDKSSKSTLTAHDLRQGMQILYVNSTELIQIIMGHPRIWFVRLTLLALVYLDPENPSRKMLNCYSRIPDRFSCQDRFTASRHTMEYQESEHIQINQSINQLVNIFKKEKNSMIMIILFISILPVQILSKSKIFISL